MSSSQLILQRQNRRELETSILSDVLRSTQSIRRIIGSDSWNRWWIFSRRDYASRSTPVLARTNINRAPTEPLTRQFHCLPINRNASLSIIVKDSVRTSAMWRPLDAQADSFRQQISCRYTTDYKSNSISRLHRHFPWLWAFTRKSSQRVDLFA